MLDQFCYRVYLPSLDRFEYYKELTNKELICIIKFSANDDDIGLSSYLEYLIEHTQTNKTYEHTRLDKYCVLFTMYAVCVKSDIKLTTKCEETDQDYNVNMNVFEILNIISNLEIAQIDKITDGNCVYHVDFPTEIYNPKENISIYDIMKSIELHGDLYEMHEYTSSQKRKLISTLPGGVVSRIMKTLNEYNTIGSDKIYMSYKSPYVEEPIPHEHVVNLLNNEMYYTLRSILSNNLKSFYEMAHGMSHNFNLSHEHYLSITPAETQIYYDLMKNEIEQRQKTTEAETSKGIENTIPGV